MTFEGGTTWVGRYPCKGGTTWNDVVQRWRAVVLKWIVGFQGWNDLERYLKSGVTMNDAVQSWDNLERCRSKVERPETMLFKMELPGTMSFKGGTTLNQRWNDAV